MEVGVGKLAAEELAALRDGVRERQHPLHVAETRAGPDAEAQRHGQIDLALDEQLALEGQGVERDRHRTLDHVLDGDDAILELVALDGRDHLGNRALRHTLARCEVGLGQQCFLGERAARPEIGHAFHPTIVGEARHMVASSLVAARRFGAVRRGTLTCSGLTRSHLHSFAARRFGAVRR